MVKLSLIVPCYNEQGNVKNFLSEVKEKISPYTQSYEVIFVNDGSRDNTAAELRELYNDNKDIRIKVVTFSRNFGKEAAMYAGFTKAQGEYITIIDADLQQDPCYVIQMAEILDTDPDCDMVAAFQSERKEGKVISAFKGMFYKVISRASGIDFVQDASDFRIMRKCVADTIVALPEYHRFSKGIFSWVGYNTRSIPYIVRERQQGETKWNFIKLVKYAVEGVIAYSDMPLKLPLYLAALTALLCLAFFVGGFFLSELFIASAILLLLAAVFLCQGVSNIYLGKIHSQVKDRPIFIAKEYLTYDTADKKTDSQV